MPRVSLGKKKYKISDFSKFVIGEMYAHDFTQQKMSQLLDCSQQTFSYKLKNNTFTYADVLTIFDTFKTEDKEIIKLMRL